MEAIGLLGKLKGGIAFLMRREEEGGVARSFDELATGLDTGVISRARAIKLAGAALAASAVGLAGAREADAQVSALGIRRRRCNRRGGDFCNTTAGNARVIYVAVRAGGVAGRAAVVKAATVAVQGRRARMESASSRARLPHGLRVRDALPMFGTSTSPLAW
jgi:hypothetical protein